MSQAFRYNLSISKLKSNRVKNIRKFSNHLIKENYMEKYLQVLPIIRLPPSPLNGKILLGKWKKGNYEGRYTGLIGKIEEEEIHELTSEDRVKRLIFLEEFAQSLVPMEIRDYVSDIQLQGLLQFDGPPDSLEHIYVASLNSLIPIEDNLSFSDKYPYHLEWFDINHIPFHNMPADDEIWYPSVLFGKKIKGSFIFGGLTQRTLKSYSMEEVTELNI